MIKISPKVKKLLSILYGIISVCLIAIYVSCMVYMKNKYRLAVGIPVGVILVCLVTWMTVYPFLYYKNYSYKFDKDRIFVSYGVIFKHQIVIPVVQIQDIHSYEGPLMQLLHLKSVIISTAGSNFVINYLTIEAAKELTDSLEYGLNKKINDSEEVIYEEVQ